MHNGDAQAVLALAQRSITEAGDKLLNISAYDMYTIALGDMLRTLSSLHLVIGYLVEQDAKKQNAERKLPPVEGLSNDIFPEQ